MPVIVMPNVNVDFKEHEFAELERKKGKKTWKEFLLDSPLQFKKWQIIAQEKGKFMVKDMTDAEMRNLSSKDVTSIPVKPNQIMVYTIYTLEKVE